MCALVWRQKLLQTVHCDQILYLSPIDFHSQVDRNRDRDWSRSMHIDMLWCVCTVHTAYTAYTLAYTARHSAEWMPCIWEISSCLNAVNGEDGLWAVYHIEIRKTSKLQMWKRIILIKTKCHSSSYYMPWLTTLIDDDKTTMAMSIHIICVNDFCAHSCVYELRYALRASYIFARYISLNVHWT